MANKTTIKSSNNNNHLPLPVSLLCRLSLFLADDEGEVDNLVAVDPRLQSFVEDSRKLKHKQQSEEDKEKGKPQPRLVIVTDAETLLARLNTKRLFRRLRDNNKSGTTITSNACSYSLNKTTTELAKEEWNALLKQQPNQKDSQSKLPPPSPHELLLFSPCPRPVTVLASYPRSGNSLLRHLFERVTLRVTGSDMRGGLIQHDLVGEAAVSARQVQFVKTHFPENIGKPAFPASRAVLLVRNPYDAIESLFHLMMTNTHTASLSEEQRTQTQQIFHDVALKEFQVWQRFHQFWLQHSQIPILLVRYEDLLRHSDKVMARVVQFVLEVNNMSFFQHRIQQICCAADNSGNQGSSSNDNTNITTGAYQPRSGGIGKSLPRYPTPLLKKINPIVHNLIHQLGYSEFLSNANNTPIGGKKNTLKLDPIPNFGFEIPVKKKDSNNNNNNKGQRRRILTINQGGIVRGPNLRTDWDTLRKQVGIQVAKEFTKDIIRNAYDLSR